MSAKSRIVKWQKIRDINTKKNYSGETSPYQEWSQFHTKNQEGDFREFPEANPDVCQEYGAEPTNEAREFLKRALRETKFTNKEKQVLLYISKGLTQSLVAKELGISRSRVAQIIRRAQKKVEKYIAKHGNKTPHGGLYSEPDEED